MKRINIKELIKNKKYVLIISIIAFILLAVGATYAYFSWTSNKINTVVSSKCFEIFYEKGNDIEGEIMPSYDYTGGLYSIIKMDINSSCNIDAIGKLYLDVSEDTSTNLYRDGLLNYQVLKNGELTDIKGSITSAGEIEIYLGKLNRNLVATTEYTIYVWIDYNLVNNNDVYSKFSGSIRGEAVQGFAQETEETLVTHITNLYLDNKDAQPVENNGISYRYASIYDKDDDETTSGGLMNDRHGSMDTEEDAGNIRYYGANPNNYIYFNCSDYSIQSRTTCEVWRIIGVFDGKVKIMRNGSIGDLAWDQDKNQNSSLTTYNNDWNTSSLQEFLNGKYYNRGGDTSLTYYTGSDGSSSVSINLESIGIKNDTTRGLISESIWYLRGWYSDEIYSNQMYDYERNIGSVSDTNNPTTLHRNIGIPYVSDYGYAVDFGICGDRLSWLGNSVCRGANWMGSVFESNTIWFMSPNPDSAYPYSAWDVNESGDFYYGEHVYYANGVVPVLHLDSELVMEYGDGSSSNPYKLYVKEENKEETFVKFLTKLYLNNKDIDLVENNSILYRYASIYDKDDDETTSGGLMNDRQGSMLLAEDDGNIRYYGANPNNYIYFNCSDYSKQSDSTCEVWRIIGIVDGKVKIMKNSSIGKLSWDQDKNQDSSLKTYDNNWGTSSLQEFLNGKYYNRGDDTSLTYYTGSKGSSSVSINLESIGIKNDTTRRLISESTWYLRGWNSSAIYLNQMYDYERNKGGLYSKNLPSLVRNIGIPYASDYGYAADLGSCSGKTLSQYSDTTCTSANWMKTVFGDSSSIWLLTHYTNAYNGAWYVSSSGNVASSGNVYSPFLILPVLYLNSELNIESGNGSSGNPYKLVIN